MNIHIYKEFTSFAHEGKNFLEIQTILKKKYNKIFAKNEILEYYLNSIYEDPSTESMDIERLLRIRATRSNSGELEVSTMLPVEKITCRYDCAMCPNETIQNGADRDMPRSYLSSEGTPKLGELEDFSPIFQIWRRLIQYEYTMGHNIDKMIHILLGGTYHSYDEKVRRDYLHNIYYCCNLFPHLSLRKRGKYSPLIKKWLQDDIPFEKKISLKSTIGLKILEELRPRKSLEEEQMINSQLDYCRVTGIVIETRPDQINKKRIQEMRLDGITRVQLGIQHTDPTLLKLINRDHSQLASQIAIRNLKDNGFKVEGHILLDLPGTTFEKDYFMCKEIFQSPWYQIDHVKLYICVDVPFTKIRQYKQNTDLLDWQTVQLIQQKMEMGDWKDLDRIAKDRGKKSWKDILVWLPNAEIRYEEFLKSLIDIIQLIPPWIRLSRFHRDFPLASNTPMRLGYESDTLKTNLQQICMESLYERGLKSKDIRSRELRNMGWDPLETKLFVFAFRNFGGIDFFISLEKIISDEEKKIIGMIRLRLSNHDFQGQRYPSWVLSNFKKKTLKIRELHVYGNLQSKSKNHHGQHCGVGKMLLHCADLVAHFYDMDEIIVISGVGVRSYYQKNGYRLCENGYMKKKPSRFLPLLQLNKKFVVQSFYDKLFSFHTNISDPNSFYHQCHVCDVYPSSFFILLCQWITHFYFSFFYFQK